MRWCGMCFLAVSLFLFSTSRSFGQATQPKPEIKASESAPPKAAQAPQPALITYKGGKLSVEAHDSTLFEILNQIGKQLNISVKGNVLRDPVSGHFGPGSPKQVVMKLLEGSDYDYALIAGTKPDSLADIVLMARSAKDKETEKQKTTTTAAASSDTKSVGAVSDSGPTTSAPQQSNSQDATQSGGSADQGESIVIDPTEPSTVPLPDSLPLGTSTGTARQSLEQIRQQRLVQLQQQIQQQPPAKQPPE